MHKLNELLVLLLFINIAYAQSISENQVPYVDPLVEKQLIKTDIVRVFIDLRINTSELKYGDLKWNVDKINLIQREFERYLTNADFLPVYKFSIVPSYSGFITQQGLEKLRKNILVKRITLVGESEKLLDNSASLLETPKLWDLGYSGSGQVVCIVDTGINYTHPSLGSCTESQFLAGNCNKVIGGFNFCANEQCTTNNMNPMDRDGHGTAVSGIVASNDSKYRGVSFEAKLVVMKVTNSTGGGTFEIIGSGIERCILNRTVYNISVITVSLGKTNFISSTTCDGSDTVVDIANTAAQYDIFVDAASGNPGNITGITSPACGSNVTSVGATDDYNSLYTLSNRGSILGLLAPGVNINTTNVSGGYSEGTGTSAAAPHVAGIAALMLQAANLSGASLTPSQIEAIMKRTGKPIYDHATRLTFPRIDAYRSVMAVLYDVFVSDLSAIHVNLTGRHIFEFSIFNDLNSAINVTWNLTTGDGTVINGTQNISLGPYNETLVYVEHFYTNPGTYTVNASITSTQGSVRSQAITITVDKYNLRAKNLTILNSAGLKRIFEFWIENNSTLGISDVYWKLNATNESEVSSVIPLTLAKNETAFIYVEYQYVNQGTQTVRAMVDPTNIYLEQNETDNTVTITD